MRSLRTGVVGVGRFGQHHTRICAELPQFELAGIHDIDFNRGKEIAKRNDTRFFTSLEPLLAACESLLIVTSTGAHADIAEEALGRGIPCFIEKPLAPQLDVARRLIELAEKKGVVLATGLLERFNPAIRAALNRIEEPQWAQFLRLGIWAGRQVSADAVADLMIHDLDMLGLFSDESLSVRRASGCTITSGYIDRCLVEIGSESGFVAHIEADRVSNHRMRIARIMDRDRLYVIDMMDQHLHTSPSLPSHSTEMMKWDQIEVDNAEPLRLELLSFYDLFHGKEARICHGRDILDSLRLMESVRSALA